MWSSCMHTPLVYLAMTSLISLHVYTFVLIIVHSRCTFSVDIGLQTLALFDRGAVLNMWLCQTQASQFQSYHLTYLRVHVLNHVHVYAVKSCHVLACTCTCIEPCICAVKSCHVPETCRKCLDCHCVEVVCVCVVESRVVSQYTLKSSKSERHAF